MKTGQLMMVDDHDEKPIKESKSYYESGQVKKIATRDRELTGEEKEYHENGS